MESQCIILHDIDERVMQAGYEEQSSTSFKAAVTENLICDLHDDNDHYVPYLFELIGNDYCGIILNSDAGLQLQDDPMSAAAASPATDVDEDHAEKIRLDTNYILQSSSEIMDSPASEALSCWQPASEYGGDHQPQLDINILQSSSQINMDSPAGVQLLTSSIISWDEVEDVSDPEMILDVNWDFTFCDADQHQISCHLFPHEEEYHMSCDVLRLNPTSRAIKRPLPEIRELARSCKAPTIRQKCGTVVKSKWAEYSVLRGGGQTEYIYNAGSKDRYSSAQGFSRIYQYNGAQGLISRINSSGNGGLPEDSTADETKRCEQTKKSSAKSQNGMSKHLASERRRRKNLNEKLLSLRALVPTISKMDKASIVVDAINYVRDLQHKFVEIKADLANLESLKEAIANGGVATSFHESNHVKARSSAKKKVLLQEHQHHILELNVSHMGGQMYNLCIRCKGRSIVMVQLTRALEFVEFKIINANLSLVNDQILNALVIEVKDGVLSTSEEVRQMTLHVFLRFGFLIDPKEKK